MRLPPVVALLALCGTLPFSALAGAQDAQTARVLGLDAHAAQPPRWGEPEAAQAVLSEALRVAAVAPAVRPALQVRLLHRAALIALRLGRPAQAHQHQHLQAALSLSADATGRAELQAQAYGLQTRNVGAEAAMPACELLGAALATRGLPTETRLALRQALAALAQRRGDGARCCWWPICERRACCL